jgi:hypothetical protein
MPPPLYMEKTADIDGNCRSDAISQATGKCHALECLYGPIVGDTDICTRMGLASCLLRHAMPMLRCHDS